MCILVYYLKTIIIIIQSIQKKTKYLFFVCLLYKSVKLLNFVLYTQNYKYTSSTVSTSLKLMNLTNVALRPAPALNKVLFQNYMITLCQRWEVTTYK